MKQSNDWTKVFREQQHLLQETPSAQTWQRIENKLETHARRRRQAGKLRLLALAASLAAVTFTGGLLRMERLHSQETFKLESLSKAAYDPQALMAIEFQRNLTAQAQGIREGIPGKKFR